MSDFEDIQRLIGLKRHELPAGDFVEDFVSRFQQRQRSELLQKSARGLLWERVTTYFEGIFAPKWAWAGAAAMAGVAIIFAATPSGSQSGSLASNSQVEISKRAAKGNHDAVTEAEVERYLISRHNEGGLADDRLDRTAPLPQQNLLPASYIRQDVEVK